MHEMDSLNYVTLCAKTIKLANVSNYFTLTILQLYIFLKRGIFLNIFISNI